MKVKGIKHYRSSIPDEATERVTAWHIRSRKRYKAEYRLSGKLIGVRYFDEFGNIQTENPLKNGLLHGTIYFFDSANQIGFAEPYVNGLAHGTARQWSHDGKLLGTYTMNRGTGVDLWRQGTDWGNGLPYLSEARYIKDGKWHGFEWWLNVDQKSVWHERYFYYGLLHGIEREWNAKNRLKRGFPRYWINGVRVTKSKYLRACTKDPTLLTFQVPDNRPGRKFPPEIVLCKPSRKSR